MRKKTAILIVLVLCCMRSSFAAVANDGIAWQALMDAEYAGKSAVFQRWHIIQTLPLVVPLSGHDVEYAAMATIVNWQRLRMGTDVSLKLQTFQGGRVEGGYVFGKRVAVYGELLAKLQERLAQLRERLAGKDDVSDGTVLEAYLAELSPVPSEAVRRYWESQLYRYKAVTGAVDAGQGKLLLDSGIPFVIKTKETCFLCVGYAEGKTQDLALLVDCGKVKEQHQEADSMFVNPTFSSIKKTTAETNTRIERMAAAGKNWIVQDEEFWAERQSPPAYASLVPWPKDGEMYAVCQPYPSYPLMVEFCEKITFTDQELASFRANEDNDVFALLLQLQNRKDILSSPQEYQAVVEQTLGADKFAKMKAEMERKGAAIQRAEEEEKRKQHEKFLAEAIKNRAEEARYQEMHAKEVRAEIEARDRELARPGAAEEVKKYKAMGKMCAAEKKGMAAQEKNTPDGKREEAEARKEYEDALKEYDKAQWERYMKQKQVVQKQQEQQAKK